MVLKTELEDIITKNGIGILRLLLRRPYLSYGLTEISSLLGVSKSNVLGYLRRIEQAGIVKTQKTARKKLYRINCSLEITKLLWLLFMAERKGGLKPISKNRIEHIFNVVKDKAEVFILFGSVAYGLEEEGSDIDILIVGDKSIMNERFTFLPHRVEFHIIKKEELEKMKDFMVLEAVMNGIVYKGDIFYLTCNLTRFPKSYVLFRLQKAKEYLIKASKLRGHPRVYYTGLANVVLGEIQALLLKKCILPKKLVRWNKDIDRLEELVSKEGDEIWLM